MSSEKKILHRVVADKDSKGNHPDFVFWCPGCVCGHGVWTTKRNGVSAVWSFNDNMEKPTFNPSILVRHKRDVTDDEAKRIMSGEKLDIPETVCHSFVRDGCIQYLGDCTHEFAGKTIPMEAF